uniref:Uncharacterized protein n=1 Tax=Strigamia maritima TaxID=126957 RepID=T1J3C4_STRMM
MHSGDSAIVKANERGEVQNIEVFEEDGMIELKDLTGWREKQMLQLQTPELETPIQEEVKDFPEMLIGELVMSDEEEEEDDMTPTTTDDSLLDDSPDNSWASININPDGSIDLDLSEGETDNIEDIISLLSESSTSSIPPNMGRYIHSTTDNTKCKFASPVLLRKSDRSVVLTPITRDFDGGLSEGSKNCKSTSKESYVATVDTCNSNSPKRPSTPFRPKSNPILSRHNSTCEQIIPTNGSPKVSRISKLKMSKAIRSYPASKPAEDDDNQYIDATRRRSKFRLPPPRKRSPVRNPYQVLPASCKRRSSGRMDGHHTKGTQTLPEPMPAQCYSGQVELIVGNKLKCSRCSYQCAAADQGVFYCDSCVEVQRVQNAFVLEIFTDQATSGDSQREQSTCYGIRIGAGLLPVIVMFVSLIVCSIVLLSDSVMSNMCGS